MAQVSEANKDAAMRQPPPLRLSRVFHARRETVFKAWSSADHVKRWFCPDTFTVPHAKVQMHVGGAFDVCMRSPTGEAHWIRGTFVEVVPGARLVIDMLCTDSAGKELFRANTEVDFSDTLGGTRLDVVQTYTLIDRFGRVDGGGGAGRMAHHAGQAGEGGRAYARRDRDRCSLGGACHLPSGAHLRRAGRAGVAGADRPDRQAEVVRRRAPAAGKCSSGTWTCASADASD